LKGVKMSKTVFLLGTTLITSVAALAASIVAYRESLVNNDIAADHHAWLHEIEHDLDAQDVINHHFTHLHERIVALENADSEKGESYTKAELKDDTQVEAEVTPVVTPVETVSAKPVPKPRAPRKPAAPVADKATDAVKATKKAVTKAADKVTDKVEDVVESVTDAVSDTTKK
jgi:hypothetical protein